MIVAISWDCWKTSTFNDDPKYTAWIVKEWIVYNITRMLNTRPRSRDKYKSHRKFMGKKLNEIWNSIDQWCQHNLLSYLIIVLKHNFISRKLQMRYFSYPTYIVIAH